MTAELIVRIFVEEKISDSQKEDLRKCINIDECIHQSWITSRHFESEITRISKSFPELNFVCIYYSDINIEEYFSEYWKNGNKKYCIENTSYKTELSALLNTLSYFENSERKNNDEKKKSNLVINILNREINKVREKIVDDSLGLHWTEITELLPKE